MNREWGCFASKTDTGTRLGRIDVAGIRDIGGDLSGQTEVIAIEVKPGGTVFTTSAGQAFGYSVYADRVYLADYRPAGQWYTPQELAIAGKLGLGLLLIRPNNRINVVQTSPLHQPLEALRRKVIDAMEHATCSICETVFRRAEGRKELVKRSDRPRSGGIRAAARSGEGYVWWLEDAAGRDGSGRKYIHPRRYLCADCATGLFHEFTTEDE